MAWLLGLAAVIGFAWLMFIDERFRRFGFGVVAVIAIGIAGVWLWTDRSNREYQAERERELSAISASQLVFTGLTLSNDGYGWRIAGRLINASAHPLRTVSLRIDLQDCPDSEAEEGCLTVGQDEVRLYADVPPRQARRVTSRVDFDNPGSLESWRWHYQVTEIEADLPSD